MDGFKIGDLIKADSFSEGDFIAVSGISKGKGFQGGMKRHISKAVLLHTDRPLQGARVYRASSYPSRVWKGIRMAGHMGCDRVTIQKMKVIDVRPDQNLILVKGAIPGPANSIVEIRKG